SDKPALYAAASLFVYPSFYEGFGFPVLEAMAMGVPVVTSNRSSLSEIAGSAATLINPNQISGLAKTIKNLLTDHPQRERQIKNGRELAVKFSWKKTAREWLQLLS
ncbi:MAG TPA: glycosyltransferase, partial [Patescibacteria group bacterium]|nr:glycosyltransferase [Patescibacteria group bacterium]